ncbi:tetratricopeptide repeat protein [Candidatus Obscuribacterales bacterium]|nr:tetratricopeptide repeat protein [Candidatus Obscuribacterales bacterium]MBX3152269.1 tetratricopeptide repeat protein [Candidatus Obscuribacterales bacterium]
MKEILDLKHKAKFDEEVGDYERAEKLLSRAIALKERSVGAEHPAMAADLHALAMLNLAMENHDRAEELLVKALGIRRQEFGANHPDVLETINAIALVQMEHEFVTQHWA